MSFSLETIVARAKRKGFVYPNSEIYGGLANARDYGPYGALLRKNITDAWIKFYTIERDDVILMDTAIIAHPTTRVASGHVGGFSDALIDDKKTGQRFRADKIIENFIESLLGSTIESEKNRYYTAFRSYTVDGIITDNSIFKDVKYFFETYYKNNNELGEKIKSLIKSGVQGSDKMDSEVNRENQRLMSEFYVVCKIYELSDGKVILPNLSPEARGNEGMYNFIKDFIPNNPDKHNQRAERTECRNFNLMLNTTLGPVADDANKVYMRPETCQSLFTDFRNVCDTTRNRIPFGLAQVGKAFRNEITPGQFLFRTREFEQMEIEYFVPADPENAMTVFEEWKKLGMEFWTQIIGISADKLRYKDHDKLAHYAAAATDIEFAFPRGFGEVQGIHNRTDFDLKQHQEHAKISMQYTDPKSGQRYIPRCVESSMGVGRCVMASMLAFYDEEKIETPLSEGEGSGVRIDTRVVIRFPFTLAPVKYAVMPLIEKSEEMVELSRNIVHNLRKQGFQTDMDASGGIGKRYRRQDEIGTPYCICVDHTSLEDGTVTIRNRDTMEQVRVKWEELNSFK